MNKQYRIALALIGIFIIPLFSGCVGGAAAHDTLIIQIEEDVLAVDNRHWSESSAYDKMVGRQWQGYLTMLSPGETIYYHEGAAVSWTMNEDGTEFSYTIREGATFHDGSPMRARDVKYSFACNFMAYAGDIYGIDNFTDALDWEESLFNVTYPASDPNGNGREFTMNGGWWPDQSYIFDAAGHWNLFMLIPEGSSGNYTDTADEIEDAIEAFDDNPVSCGPYKFVEHQAQEYVLLERWDDWWGWGQTYTDNGGNQYTYPAKDNAFKYLRFRPIEEPAMALVELRTGGVDVTTSRFDSQAALENIWATEDYDAYTIDVLGGAGLEPNTEGNYPVTMGGPGNFPVSEEWFRKAVSHGINRTNIVENVYGGIAGVREVVYPDWLLEKFPDIDTADYYDFGIDIAKAQQILDDEGYTALGFSSEPGNRFGYGPDMRDTAIDTIEQTKGHHFIITTMSTSAWTVNRALAVQKDLKDIGIYVDVELLEWGSYIDALNEAMPGRSYNQSYVALDEKDPLWNGPHWDFTLGGYGYYYETPQQFAIYMGSYYWFWQYGGTPSVYNASYEEAYAKIAGGNGYMSRFPGGSTEEFPYPEWSATDTQYVEACEEAGRLMSHMLSTIPLVWYRDTYAFDIHLKNFLSSRAGDFHCAYAYWE